MTDTQWQDAAARRLQALDRRISFYSSRQDESINRVHLGMAKGERKILAVALLKSRGA